MDWIAHLLSASHLMSVWGQYFDQWLSARWSVRQSVRESGWNWNLDTKEVSNTGRPLALRFFAISSWFEPNCLMESNWHLTQAHLSCFLAWPFMSLIHGGFFSLFFFEFLWSWTLIACRYSCWWCLCWAVGHRRTLQSWILERVWQTNLAC